MSLLRVGIIGAGNVGTGTARGDSFISVLEAFPDARVTSVCDVSHEHAARAARVAGATPFTELGPFLDSGLDAVIVCTPIRYHAEQSIAALARGIHVLSEVPAVHTLEAANHLAAAAEHSSAIYMLAENYRYLDEIELIKRLATRGNFGEIYYAEGEYVHDCRDLSHDEEGAPTWRGETGKGTGLGVYCTHSLGPLLYVLDDRVTQVAALANETARMEEGRASHFNFIMLMRTAKGATLRVRVDTVSPRPHVAAYYAVQGTRGCYESWRGLGDEPKVWFAEEHEESHCRESAQWHPLAAYREQHIPDREGGAPEARRGGHGTTEYWMLKDFMDSIRRQEQPPIDVHRGLDYTVPGLCALESVEQDGAVMAVPDSRAPFA